MKQVGSPAILMDLVLPKRRLIADIALITGLGSLTALSAQVSFWIGPVPITGQTFAVLLAGAILGSRRGALSMLTYLGIGLSGLPFWFALGGPLGIARLIGPTGGYLIGFIPAAFVVGWLAERGWTRRIWTTALAMLIGCVVYYAFGLTWLAHFVPAEQVLAVGLYPFIVGDLLKVALAASAVPLAIRWLEKHHIHREPEL
jgi:biotin transporter BioY